MKTITYENIFGEIVTVSTKKTNPMVKAYGKGTDEERLELAKIMDKYFEDSKIKEQLNKYKSAIENAKALQKEQTPQ